MINVQSLFHSFCEYGKTYKAGPDPLPEWNNKLAEAQRELMDLIAPLYDQNERIRTLMRPFVKTYSGVTNSTGLLSLPTDYYRMVGSANAVVGSVTFPARFSYEGGVVINSRIPQRAPSLTNRIAYFHPTLGGLQFYPREAFTVLIHYIKIPATATLNYQYVVNSNTDERILQLNSGSTVNLEWNEDAFGLLLFILLEKYGIISKDQLLTEYGKLGINSDLIKAK